MSNGLSAQGNCWLMGRRKNKSKTDLYVACVALVLILLILNPQATVSFLALLFYVSIFIAAIYFLKSIFKKNKKPTGYSQSPEHSNYKSRVEPTLDASADTTEKVQEWSIDLIHSLEWKKFEELSAGYFTATGYRAEVSRFGADGGIDIFLYKESYSQDKAFAVVQCKAWSTYKVGVKPVRELYGVMASEKAPLGIFITSGDYTREAQAFADGKHLKLITGASLLALLKALPDERQQSLIAKITKGDYTTPSCPSCGDKMVKRKAKKGTGNEFWGCVNFPRCRHTLRMKKGG